MRFLAIRFIWSFALLMLISGCLASKDRITRSSVYNISVSERKDSEKDVFVDMDGREVSSIRQNSADTAMISREIVLLLVKEVGIVDVDDSNITSIPEWQQVINKVFADLQSQIPASTDKGLQFRYNVNIMQSRQVLVANSPGDFSWGRWQSRRTFK